MCVGLSFMPLTCPPRPQLWGSTTANLDLHGLLDGTNPYLLTLAAEYNYVMWQPGAYSWRLDPSVPRVDITRPLQLHDPITLPIYMGQGNSWYIDVASEGGWEPGEGG